MKKPRNIVSKSAPYITLACLLSGWEAMVGLHDIPTWILPAPSQIAAALWSSRALIWYHTIPTLLEALLGLTCAIAAGMVLAFVIEWSPAIKRIIYPILVASQTIPTIALAPLLVIWFGFGIISKIVIIALVCFFPIVINMTDGFRMLDHAWLNTLRAMGARPFQLFRLVKFPVSLPGFFSGVKIAGAYSILGAVISEWFGASHGLGILLMRASKSYLTARVFATILVITILTLLLTSLIELIARFSIPWHYRKQSVSD